MAVVVDREQLPHSGLSCQFEGHLWAPGTPVSFYWLEADPGQGPGPHTHPYPEVLIVLEGEADVIAGDETIRASTGDIIVVAANEVHGFKNVGTGKLRQVDIHCSDTMVQHNLPAAS